MHDDGELLDEELERDWSDDVGREVDDVTGAILTALVGARDRGEITQKRYEKLVARLDRPKGPRLKTVVRMLVPLGLTVGVVKLGKGQ